MRVTVVLGGALAGLAGARGRRDTERKRLRPAEEGRALERALFSGRCLGGAMVIVLGPPAVAPTWPWPFYALGAYFFAYAALMLRIQERADSAAARRDAASLAHVFDTVGFIGGLALGSISPAWLVTNAAPVYILIATFRSGTAAAWSATAAISVAHVGLALWRDAELGIAFDPSVAAVHIGVYLVSALISAGIESELRALRARHDAQRALAELERVDRLEGLGSLAAGIAHDFNNLLAVVLTNAHLALTAEASGPSRRELEEIRDAAQRGAQLTRQLLGLRRGESPSTELIDVGRAAREAEPLLRRILGPRVTLDVRIAGAPVSVLAPGEIERVLVNLAANARDAMPDGGLVSVSIDEVAIDAAAALPRLVPGAYIRVVVRDTGVGMSAEVAQRAFEPFFTTKSERQGSGLGLATVFAIVRRAGGHIGLGSAEGIGTTVTIHLPAARRR